MITKEKLNTVAVYDMWMATVHPTENVFNPQRVDDWNKEPATSTLVRILHPGTIVPLTYEMLNEVYPYQSWVFNMLPHHSPPRPPTLLTCRNVMDMWNQMTDEEREVWDDDEQRSTRPLIPKRWDAFDWFGWYDVE